MTQGPSQEALNRIYDASAKVGHAHNVEGGYGASDYGDLHTIVGPNRDVWERTANPPGLWRPIPPLLALATGET